MAPSLEPRADTPPAAELEQALARRMHLLAAWLVIGACLPYLFLLLRGPARPGGAELLAMAVFGVCAALASLLWVRRTRRYVAAILLLCWPVFIGMSLLMIAQGGVAGTAVWWLPVAPLIALQGGATRGGVAMAVLLVVELATVQGLRQAGALPAPLLLPLGETQRLLAATASVACIVTVVALGVQWRRSLLRELDRALVAARAAGQARSRFITNMSHEIRTPLNGIVGAAELLRGSALDAGQQRSLDVLRDSADALMRLVDDVLDFSKLEAGRMHVERTAFALHDVMHEAVELFAAAAEAKGIELSVQVQRDVPGHVVGDPARLRQILHNLVANAVKFTPSGEVQLRAGVAAAGADGQPWLQLAVRDTGIGMTATQRGRLFAAFEQGDGSTTRRFGGSGLGLAISRELAELLGGRIEAESEPGLGATFTLQLPLTAAPAPSGTDAPAVLAGRRVWLVSPTAGVRDSLAAVIAHAGASVEALASLPTPAALAQAREQGVGVLLVDARALAPAGLDAAAWAAQLAAARWPGVLLVGPAAHPQDLPAGIALVYKPARPALLVEALRGALAPPVAAAPPPPAPAPDATSAAPRSRRVLLVEDHPVNQIVARSMLEGLGLHTVVAASGFEAIRHFTQPPDAIGFELVLMDCQMPELDGMACTRRLREIEARAARRRTPIVAMTADSEAEVGADCIAAGMDGFLAKPVRLQQLQGIIDRWVPRAAA